MEIVSIERKTFEDLVAKFDRFVIQPNQPQDVLPSRRCATYRLHCGGQAKGSEIQRQDNLITE